MITCGCDDDDDDDDGCRVLYRTSSVETNKNQETKKTKNIKPRTELNFCCKLSMRIIRQLFLLISFGKAPAFQLQNSTKRGYLTNTRINMGWATTWSDIVSGGNPRWKVTCKECHEKALHHFQTYVKGEPSNTSVLCPLAGDDPFVYLLFLSGYSVTTIDLVPAAVEEMKSQFGSCKWTKDEADNTVIWKHESGRATLMVGDALQKRPQLFKSFDAVYDKDSFGALDKNIREGFCVRIAEYTKQDSIVYLECKLKNNHEEVKDNGPPFSLKGEDLMEDIYYGASFDYVKGLGSVYDISMPMEQTGHILRRK